MPWDLVVRHSWLFAAALAVILFILLWWAAEREAREYITRMGRTNKMTKQELIAKLEAAIRLEGGNLRKDVAEILSRAKQEGEREAVLPCPDCKNISSGPCINKKMFGICYHTGRPNPPAHELPAPKKCPHFGDGIQSNKGCPGSINTRHCPNNTDEDCNLLPAPQEPAYKLDSAHDQLQVVKERAIKEGYHKAADWITSMQGRTFSEPAPTSQEGLDNLIQLMEVRNKIKRPVKMNTVLAWAYQLKKESRHPAVAPVAVEPSLEELAKRKGYGGVLLQLYIDGWKLILWRTYKETGVSTILCPNNMSEAEAESKARAYLSALRDKGEGGGI